MHAILAQTGMETHFYWTRLQLFHAWWHWPVLLAVLALIVLWVGWLYRRDTVELPWGSRLALLVLRLVALTTMVLFFFGLEKRSERRIHHPSRVAILIDDSQSMALPDTTEQPPLARIDRARRLLASTEWLGALRSRHEVLLYKSRDAEQPQQIGLLPYVGSETRDDEAETISNETDTPWGVHHAAAMAVGIVLGLVYLAMWLRGANERIAGRFLLASVITLLAATVWLAWFDLTHAPPDVWRGTDGDTPTTVASPTDPPSEWETVLHADGETTRLGDNLHAILQANRGQPLAGLIILTDGAENSGRESESILGLARQQAVPLFPIGVGTATLPSNLRVLDLQVPPRVYPNDQFRATAYVQASRFAGQDVEVQLFVAPVGESEGDETMVDTRLITCPDDESVAAVLFELEPPEAGEWSYRASIAVHPDESDDTDNSRSARVEIVDGKTRVLLMAGGPTREYRFLRNQLFRDRSMETDVLLATAEPGTAQEAAHILSTFPTSRDQLGEYDCLVAFDVDWTELGPNEAEIFEEWVSHHAGGVLFVAGPVHTRRWAETMEDTSSLRQIRAMQPVQFYRRGRGTANLGRTASATPWLPQFTPEGRAARFLWLGDSADASAANWAGFPGVYGYFAVQGTKPAATTYAYFSDPSTAVRGELPPYLVGQFYGSGRTMFLASGELWRLREVNVAFQEQLYTKLIRYLAEGRLLRDSKRGVLFVDKQRCIRGERVVVRATLKDQQRQPYQAEQVDATLVAPDRTRRTLVLRAVPDSVGSYQAVITGDQPGTYELHLPVPGGDDLDVLTQQIQVRLADQELEQPLRNDALLQTMASETSGTYYRGTESVSGNGETPSLVDSVQPRQQVALLQGAPHVEFDRRWMRWLMIFLVGSLCLEWLLRRLHRLA